MFKLFEFRNSKGEVIAEVPIIIRDAELFHEMLDSVLPEIVQTLLSITLRTLYMAADTERGKGPHQIEKGISYIGIGLEAAPIKKQESVEAQPPFQPDLQN